MPCSVGLMGKAEDKTTDMEINTNIEKWSPWLWSGELVMAGMAPCNKHHWMQPHITGGANSIHSPPQMHSMTFFYNVLPAASKEANLPTEHVVVGASARYSMSSSRKGEAINPLCNASSTTKSSPIAGKHGNTLNNITWYKLWQYWSWLCTPQVQSSSGCVLLWI